MATIKITTTVTVAPPPTKKANVGRKTITNAEQMANARQTLNKAFTFCGSIIHKKITSSQPHTNPIHLLAGWPSGVDGSLQIFLFFAYSHRHYYTGLSCACMHVCTFL